MVRLRIVTTIHHSPPVAQLVERETVKCTSNLKVTGSIPVRWISFGKDTRTNVQSQDCTVLVGSVIVREDAFAGLFLDLGYMSSKLVKLTTLKRHVSRTSKFPIGKV